MFDTQAIKDGVDMLELVESELGQGTKQGQWYAWPCPFHDENTPSFKVNSQTQSWRCFGACHKSGDAIDWVMAYKELDFKESCKYLQQFVKSQPAMSIPRPPITKVKSVPTGDIWQNRASVLVNESRKRLWRDNAGADALTYLRQRGLNDETIRNAQLGYNVGHKEQRTDWGLSFDDYRNYITVDNGIVIPSLVKGIPQRITIRRFPKVENVAGEE